jgi:hypothetical protein
MPIAARTALFLALAAAMLPRPSQASEPLWRQLMPRKNVEADPRGDYTLAERNGPWLIMAASFSGEGAEEDARALVLELRKRFNLPAYYYAITCSIESRPSSPMCSRSAKKKPIRKAWLRCGSSIAT